MSPVLVYIPQNGDIFKTVLDAMVTLMNASTFKTALDIIMTLVVCMTGYQYVTGKKIESLTRFVCTTFFVLYGLIGLHVPVAIIDMQEAEGAGKALTVDNVPIGMALPATIISHFGYGITALFSDILHTEDNTEYNKTGMIFGARSWLAATDSKLSMSPELSADLSAYLRQCIFSAKVLASHQITPKALVKSNNLLGLYFDSPSPIYRVILQDGQNLGCIEAATNIKKRLPDAVDKELKRLGKILVKGSTAKYNNALEAAQHYYMDITTNAADILTQNILINATRDAASDAFAFTGAESALMNYTNTTSLQKMHIAEANSFWLAGFRLPYFMTVMWMLTISIFPLVVLIALFPLSQNVYIVYLQSQAFLWSWPPMFIIIHFFVSLAARGRFFLFGGTKGGVTFSNIDTLSSFHSNFAYTAGALAASVPVIAYYLTKGLGPILTTASQHFGGMAQSLSVGEAQSVGQGNISMASYSGWNMNYDNTNAHKFDTNAYHAEGRSTLQMNNGALLSQNADGSSTGNIQPAISSSAVNVHGSNRVVDALNKSSTESFGHATQLRAAGDKHIQEGLNELKQFNEQDANDYRSGAGISNTVTDSMNQDLRAMKDAVKHYNDHADVSQHASLEAALAERLSSNKQFLGKLIEFGSGASIEGSITGRASVSGHHSQQWFNNSSEGQAFNKAYNHLVATAKTNHLDTSDSHHLSKAEQIGANFAKGESLLTQSSSEYSHAQQLQNAASHTKEHADNIDSNLNQAYHDWVVQRFGEAGESIMLKADGQSVAQQNAWAEEFLNSSSGKNAVAQEVDHALLTKSSDLQRAHHQEASIIQKNAHINSAYQKSQEMVESKSNLENMHPMDSSTLSEAQNIQQQHRAVSVSDDAKKIRQEVTEKLKSTDKTIVYKKLNNKE